MLPNFSNTIVFVPKTLRFYFLLFLWSLLTCEIRFKALLFFLVRKWLPVTHQLLLNKVFSGQIPSSTLHILSPGSDQVTDPRIWERTLETSIPNHKQWKDSVHTFAPPNWSCGLWWTPSSVCILWGYYLKEMDSFSKMGSTDGLDTN